MLGTLLSLVLVSGAHAQSLQEKSEPSVQCGKQAAERFARDWSERHRANFANYYNSRLNKCFYLEISALYEGAQKMLHLIDLHEDRVIGSYDKLEGEAYVVCWVQDKRCHSEEEWRALTTPFMED